MCGATYIYDPYDERHVPNAALAALLAGRHLARLYWHLQQGWLLAQGFDDSPESNRAWEDSGRERALAKNVLDSLATLVFSICVPDPYPLHREITDTWNVIEESLFSEDSLVDLTDTAVSFGVGRRDGAIDKACEFVTDELDREMLEQAQRAATGIADIEIAEDEHPGFDADAVLDTFGIDVLGETEDQGILCWMKFTNKRGTIKNPSNWRSHEMFQAVGEQAAEHLWVNGDDEERPAGTFTPWELQKAVALAASKAPRISQQNIIGQGVWKQGDRLLVVDGTACRTYDGESFRRLRRPKLGRKIIDFNADKEWPGQLPEMVTY